MDLNTGASSRITFPSVINSLTSLRYFAAAWVVVFHCREYFMQSWAHHDKFIASGRLGVDFFFILSGFVIAHVYLKKLAEGRFDYWNFVTRRFARVYPLHFLMLITMLGFGVLAHRYALRFSIWTPAMFYDLEPGQRIREVVAHLTLIHAWGAGSGLYFNLPAWSISAEWFAYLLFPVVALIVLRCRSGVVAIAIGVAAFMGMDLATMAYSGPPLTEMTWNIGALRIAPEFLLGVCAYRLGTEWSLGRKGAFAGFLGSILAIVLLVYLGAPALVTVPFFATMILFASDAERHGGMRWTAHPLPILLGEVSYAAYMIHFPFAVAFYDLVIPGQQGATGFVALGWLLFGLAAITGLSVLSHWYFELPVRNLLIRLSTLPRGERVAAKTLQGI